MKHETDPMIYKGKSMAGTFCFGDRLVLECIPLTDILEGEIVVYRSTNNTCQEEWVVHRVIKKTIDGLVVQGDKNLRPDSTLVTQSNFAGKVVHIIRGTSTIKIHRSLRGNISVILTRGFLKTEKWINFYIRKLFRKPYTALRTSQLSPRFWHPKIKKMLVLSKEGPIEKYIIGNRTVAEYKVRKRQLACRKPYDLVLWPIFKKEKKVPN